MFDSIKKLFRSDEEVPAAPIPVELPRNFAAAESIAPNTTGSLTISIGDTEFTQTLPAATIQAFDKFMATQVFGAERTPRYTSIADIIFTHLEKSLYNQVLQRFPDQQIQAQVKNLQVQAAAAVDAILAPHRPQNPTKTPKE